MRERASYGNKALSIWNALEFSAIAPACTGPVCTHTNARTKKNMIFRETTAETRNAEKLALQEKGKRIARIRGVRAPRIRKHRERDMATCMCVTRSYLNEPRQPSPEALTNESPASRNQVPVHTSVNKARGSIDRCVCVREALHAR